ncbi:MAG: hypothetical protein EAZ14_04335 [Runella slithyformis]|nr:MAG: hypothetical protein EAZ80_00555 [Runella slithyformis]TAF31928.1 MAG: hypothetical protein EAZ67_11095 [Cytophagales bacterium]TAF95494.1 MAG: hypothetical protein EAZ46_07595 [Runella sp.]TAG40490.1 MAG: hypothetical protein EAZ32_06360 [Cytophagia bacterium]TAF80473.1 MAG: hypothetical protein EAZ50_08730 [Runella slithyformis]
MTQTFTPNDVLRYVYEETSAQENLLIEDALLGNSQLLDFYLEALEMKLLMNKISRTPHNRVVDKILDFSRNYNLNQSVALPA